MEQEIKKKIDVVLDCMNTLMFLAGIGTKNNPEKLHPDVNHNDVMIYDNTYMWEVCEALERMPSIEPITWETESTNKFKVSMYYRGVEFHTYIKEEEKAFFEDRIADYEAKIWEEMEYHSHDDDEE